MIHNQIASVVSLAKQQLLALDPSQSNVTLPREMLSLLLTTFIQMAEGQAVADHGDARAKVVQGRVAAVAKAMGG